MEEIRQVRNKAQKSRQKSTKNIQVLEMLLWSKRGNKEIRRKTVGWSGRVARLEPEMLQKRLRMKLITQSAQQQ